jgi:hypothetical protein
MPDVLQWLDVRGRLRLGGGLTVGQVTALNVGKVRAQQNLDAAAALSVEGNEVRVVNLTGHKLISGYPEGRRMWLRVTWRDAAEQVLAEDGAYGTILADVSGTSTPVATLLDLDPAYTPVYEAHGAITQEWASQLVSLGVPTSLPLSFDRASGTVARTLGSLADQAPGTHLETFHFVLNNHLAKDNRIPPWGMRHDDAVQRNIQPVPPDQYGAPGPGGVYEHWDRVTLNPPAGAHHATVELLYQPTSWEYVQFLDLANTGQSAFLAAEGDNVLEAWLATGMAAPYVMDSATWVATLAACADGLDNDGDGLSDAGQDPGCSGAGDASENDAARPCDDRLDSDGDGATDFPRDPGCRDPVWPLENPQCQDGLDNDADGRVDWDGGGSGGRPDPQCTAPWRNLERKGACGLGLEVGVLLPLLLLGARRLEARRRRV